MITHSIISRHPFIVDFYNTDTKAHKQGHYHVVLTEKEIEEQYPYIIFPSTERRDRIVNALIKTQRDNLAEVVACKTDDKSLYYWAKVYEERVKEMDPESDFGPILNEICKKFGIIE